MPTILNNSQNWWKMKKRKLKVAQSEKAFSLKYSNKYMCEFAILKIFILNEKVEFSDSGHLFLRVGLGRKYVPIWSYLYHHLDMYAIVLNKMYALMMLIFCFFQIGNRTLYILACYNQRDVGKGKTMKQVNDSPKCQLSWNRKKSFLDNISNCFMLNAIILNWVCLFVCLLYS